MAWKQLGRELIRFHKSNRLCSSSNVHFWARSATKVFLDIKIVGKGECKCHSFNLISENYFPRERALHEYSCLGDEEWKRERGRRVVRRKKSERSHGASKCNLNFSSWDAASNKTMSRRRDHKKISAIYVPK